VSYGTTITSKLECGIRSPCPVRYIRIKLHGLRTTTEIRIHTLLLNLKSEIQRVAYSRWMEFLQRQKLLWNLGDRPTCLKLWWYVGQRWYISPEPAAVSYVERTRRVLAASWSRRQVYPTSVPHSVPCFQSYGFTAATVKLSPVKQAWLSRYQRWRARQNYAISLLERANCFSF
jgi:hypothetical protein